MYLNMCQTKNQEKSMKGSNEMKKEKMKKRICDLLEKTVKESVGKSVPIILHEPKMPECLKKNK